MLGFVYSYICIRIFKSVNCFRFIVVVMLDPHHWLSSNIIFNISDMKHLMNEVFGSHGWGRCIGVDSFGILDRRRFRFLLKIFTSTSNRTPRLLEGYWRNDGPGDLRCYSNWYCILMMILGCLSLYCSSLCCHFQCHSLVQSLSGFFRCI